MHTEKVFPSATVSGLTYTSSFDLYRCSGYSYQVRISDKVNLSGAFLMLQASNNDTDWTDMSDTRLDVEQAGDVDACFLEDAQVGYRYVRLKIDSGSGSFTAGVWFNAQEGVYS